ncbi:MAG: BON domain-containing protein [Armatimonadota bacterium]
MSLINDALMAMICDRLACDRRVSALPIDVCCCDGQVSLIGVVDTAEQKRLALDLVSGVMGVHSVIDQIMVKLPPGATLTIGETGL